MRHFALRLVIALLTFVVGVTVSSIWSFKRAVILERQSAPTAVLVAAPSVDEPPPVPHSCSSKTIVFGDLLNGKAISKPQPVCVTECVVMETEQSHIREPLAFARRWLLSL